MKPTWDELIAEFDLERLRSGIVDKRSYVNLPGMPWERIDEYNWPAADNGTRLDRRVFLMIFHDGSYSVSLQLEPNELREASTLRGTSGGARAAA